MVRAAHAFFVLSVLVLVWPAAAQNMRTRAVDPLPATAGSAFEFAEQFKDAAAIDALIASNPVGLGEPLQRFQSEYRAKMNGMSADTAASDYINSLNALRDARIVVTFLRAVYPERTIFLSALRSVKTEFQMPDGSKKQIPVVASSLLGQIQAHLAGAKLQGEPIGQIGGDYRVDTEGDCPFTSGPITLTQKSFLAEGTRADELLLTGAVGDGTAVFLAYEPRFASAVETMAPALSLVVPDRPPVVYSAPLGAEQLVLTDNDHACKIALMRR